MHTYVTLVAPYVIKFHDEGEISYFLINDPKVNSRTSKEDKKSKFLYDWYNLPGGDFDKIYLPVDEDILD